MFVPFESLPDHARAWIYQANRKFSSAEKDILDAALFAFTQHWQVHGKPMKTSFKIEYDQFLVLAADENYNAASGCSIDGSVRELKSLGKELGIDFFDRTLIAFKKEAEIVLVPVSAVNKKYQEGFWNAETFTFNNLVSTIEGFKKSWLVRAGDTWLSRYFVQEKVAL